METREVQDKRRTASFAASAEGTKVVFSENYKYYHFRNDGGGLKNKVFHYAQDCPQKQFYLHKCSFLCGVLQMSECRLAGIAVCSYLQYSIFFWNC